MRFVVTAKAPDSRSVESGATSGAESAPVLGAVDRRASLN